MSDGTFAKIVEDLRVSSVPLVESDGDTLAVTALGRRVLAGDSDWLEAAGIDRWIGGVHLHSSNATRWDDEKVQFYGVSS